MEGCSSYISFCRTCLSNDTTQFSVFEPWYLDERFTLSDMIRLCTNVEINENSTDNLSTKICEKCVNTLDQSFTFRRKCQETESFLREKYKIDSNYPTDITKLLANHVKQEPQESEYNTNYIIPKVSVDADVPEVLVKQTPVLTTESMQIIAVESGNMDLFTVTEIPEDDVETIDHDLSPVEVDTVIDVSSEAVPKKKNKIKNKKFGRFDADYDEFNDAEDGMHEEDEEKSNDLHDTTEPTTSSAITVPVKRKRDFYRVSNAEYHKRMIDKLSRRLDLRTNGFKCCICSHYFKTAEERSVHEGTHRDTRALPFKVGEKPFKCECGMKFSREIYLQKHKMVGDEGCNPTPPPSPPKEIVERPRVLGRRSTAGRPRQAPKKFS